VIVTVLIPLLLTFHRSRREHHKNLTLIVPETPRPGRTGRPILLGIPTLVIGSIWGRSLLARQLEKWRCPRGTTIHPAETIDSKPPTSAEGVLTPFDAMGLQQWRTAAAPRLRDEVTQIRHQFQIRKPKPRSSASRRSLTRQRPGGPTKSKPRSIKPVEPLAKRIRTRSTQK
jgi:hypothetical protein